MVMEGVEPDGVSSVERVVTEGVEPAWSRVRVVMVEVFRERSSGQGMQESCCQEF